MIDVRALWRCGLCVVIGLAEPAAAQDQLPPAKSDDIIVTGVKNNGRDWVEDFVAALTATRGNDPLARFDSTRLCPRAFGLGTEQDNAITDRMRRIAAAAKIDLAKETCRWPNAVVIFADDKAVTVALLRKRYPWLFDDSHGSKVTGKEAGSAVMWHVKGMVGEDGVPIVATGGDVAVRHTTQPGSRITAAARPVFVMSVLVIERRGINGLTTTQVADYAAMRSYADADPARAKASGAPTIVSVLDAPMGSETPVSLTAWDLSFLRGFYAAQPNLHATAQRGEITDTIKRDLSKGSGQRR